VLLRRSSTSCYRDEHAVIRVRGSKFTATWRISGGSITLPYNNSTAESVKSKYIPTLFGSARESDKPHEVMRFRGSGLVRYTAQFDGQRVDEDPGMAGLPGVSERD
jgi:hypothetical protein